jgi:hypothetical protein
MVGQGGTVGGRAIVDMSGEWEEVVEGRPVVDRSGEWGAGLWKVGQ